MKKIIKCFIAFGFVALLSLFLIRIQFKAVKIEDFTNLAFLNTSIFYNYGLNRFNLILIMNYSLFIGASTYCFLVLSRGLVKDYTPFIIYRFRSKKQFYYYCLKQLFFLSAILFGIKTLVYLIAIPFFFRIEYISLINIVAYFIKLMLVDYLIGLLILTLSYNNHSGYILSKIIIMFEFVVISDSMLEPVDIIKYSTGRTSIFLGIILCLVFIMATQLMFRNKIKSFEL